VYGLSMRIVDQKLVVPSIAYPGTSLIGRRMRSSPRGALALLVSIDRQLPASLAFFRGHIYLVSNQDTYDHRSVRTGHPVRSAIHKH
jgi:hypothetical protein